MFSWSALAFRGLSVSARSSIFGRLVRSFQIRHRNQLSVKAWEKAIRSESEVRNVLPQNLRTNFEGLL